MKILMILPFLFGALAVVTGAFGAHALGEKLTPDQLAVYKTGVLYHFLHAMIGAVAVYFYIKYPHTLFLYAIAAFMAGILFFSGSIYLLSTRALTGWEVSVLGPITPFGGLLFIIGWLLMAIAVYRIA